MENREVVIVAMDSCGEELEQFVAWMEEAHPDVDLRVENTMRGNGQEYWEEYCKTN